MDDLSALAECTANSNMWGFVRSFLRGCSESLEVDGRLNEKISVLLYVLNVLQNTKRLTLDPMIWAGDCSPGWFVSCQSWCWGWPGPAQSISLNQGDSGKKQLEIRLQGITSHRLHKWNVWIHCWIVCSLLPLPWLELKLRPILDSPLRWSSKARLLLSSLSLTRLLELISL